MLNDGKRNKIDAVSVDMWVNEQMNSESHSVVYYKKQGQKDDNFSENDFCLIIMNKSQEFMLEEYGNNIIAIDSTHGLNGYDFELTTLMVVDEYGEGFPAACMFCNRQDTFVYKIFFKKLKDKLSHKITPKTFMSDITETFYQAWIEEMGIPTYRLFCAWHIDRAWQKNLNKVSKSDKKKWVYKTLKYLQYFNDKNYFLHTLEKTLQLFFNDPETVEFAYYFKNNYSENFKLWAHCFRQECGINTNMHLESMHKNIKYFYLNGTVVKRLDKGLHAVLKYTRDKIVERIIKQTKGKSTRHMNKIINRHRTSLNSSFNINQVSDGEYALTNAENTTYKITKVANSPCCELICKICFVCLHSFQCTCPDYFLHNTICKHIHYLMLHLEPLKNTIKFPTEEIPYSHNEEVSVHLNTIGHANSVNTSGSLKDKIFSKLEEIKKKTSDNVDERSLHECLNYLKRASVILDIGVDAILPINIDNRPVNKKNEKQINYFSTKKKRSLNKLVMKKPNQAESHLLEEIINNKPFVSKHESNDHVYGIIN